MTTWTREHDATLAQECDGTTFDATNYTYESKPSIETGDVVLLPIPSYSTDLSAIARAGEAWRTKDEDIDRTIQVNSPVERMGLPFRVECSENYRVGKNYEWRTFKGEAEDEAQARAWALYNAVKGIK